jgi:hypothetical protein
MYLNIIDDIFDKSKNNIILNRETWNHLSYKREWDKGLYSLYSLFNIVQEKEVKRIQIEKEKSQISSICRQSDSILKGP